MEHPGKALPEGAAGIGFAFGTSGLKAFAASGAASPVRCPCPQMKPRGFMVSAVWFKAPGLQWLCLQWLLRASHSASMLRYSRGAKMLEWFFVLRALTASEMRFLSENDVRYALVKENGL